ncbi:hypothetical protein NLN92_18950 [Citrobacter portucalensis]|uniref:hypothetical protein n=1 Tax=Citrobacter portucalensis TaxID=1639133 RepID=UPI00226B5BC2|nr:hypothetical protein [Citrobacter portucalensis]MCX8980085.1 hypothetical protein [Citrobacter portucalensis]
MKQKSQMKRMVRAWKKELKDPRWDIKSRKKRADLARDWASASIESADPFTCQQDADDWLNEELLDWAN